MTDEVGAAEDGERAKPDEVTRRDDSTTDQYRAAVAIRREMRTGPLPPPDEIRQLREIDPAYVERVFAMAEREQSHRHELDRMEVRQPYIVVRWGQVLGLTVALAGFVLTGWLAWVHQPVIAGIIGVLDLVALVSVFVAAKAPERGADKDGSDP